MKKLIVMLMLGFVLSLSLIAPTLGAKATFDVSLQLKGDGDAIIVECQGYAQWPTLEPGFRGFDNYINVDGVELEVILMAVKRKSSKIIAVILFFKDWETDTKYHTNWIPVDPAVLRDIDGFVLLINADNEPVFRKVKGKAVELGTVDVGIADYTPTP